MIRLPHSFHCGSCDRHIRLPERPERIPPCPSCGRIMRAAWELDGERAPEVVIHRAEESERCQ